MTNVTEAMLAAWQHQQEGNPQQAEQLYRQILANLPGDERTALAETHSSLGIALATQGRLDEAIESFRHALAAWPDYPEAHNNLGNVLVMQNRQAEAEACFQRAMQLKPNYAQAHCNLGVAYLEQGKLEASQSHLEEALRLDPNYVDAQINLGNVFRQACDPLRALDCYQRALQLAPQNSDAHWNRALAWLMAGEFERGWPEYEWRWLSRLTMPRNFSQPRWDGSPLEGRTILLYAEQGLGDTLQFIRYAPLVKRYGGRVVVECQAALLKLLESCEGIDQLVLRGSELPPHDVQFALMSLAMLFRSTQETLPAKVPYVFARPELVERWRNELSASKSFKIGITWQGNPQFRDDVHRSIPLRAFAPLAKVPGVQLYSLQKGFGVEQIEQVAGEFPVVELGSRVDVETGPFLDTAAVVQNLDLVVSPNSVLAHLAGSLGKPVWLALSTIPEWRWTLGRDDSLWYPTMHIFRQQQLGGWDGVFQRMADALAAQLARGASAGSIAVEVPTGELIDKITILEIKSERMSDEAKLRNVREELRVLSGVRDRAVTASPGMSDLTAQLKRVNEELWEIEDQIRDRERDKDFGPEFVALARSVYRQNDRRAKLKRQINELAGSHLVEEKSYADYE